MTGLTFQLSDYRLFKVEFQVKTPAPGEKNPNFDTNLFRSFHIEKDKVILVLGIKISGDNMPFTIDVQYQAAFVFNQDLTEVDEKAREKIIAVNCSGQLFPFIRESIAELTRKSGFPPMILPTYNFVELYDNQQKIDSK